MIEIILKKPSLEEYLLLRNSVGWEIEKKGISLERVKKSLDNSPLIVCAYDGDKIIGMARISGDLEMYGYIQDTIVLERYRGKGIGKKIIETIIENIKEKRGYLLGVCPSKDSVKFYESFGFRKRPEEPNGFMSLEFS